MPLSVPLCLHASETIYFRDISGYPLMDFCQTFVICASSDKDELIRLQVKKSMVKVTLTLDQGSAKSGSQAKSGP